jgi:hypothetical protein
MKTTKNQAIVIDSMRGRISAGIPGVADTQKDRNIASVTLATAELQVRENRKPIEIISAPLCIRLDDDKMDSLILGAPYAKSEESVSVREIPIDGGAIGLHYRYFRKDEWGKLPVDELKIATHLAHDVEDVVGYGTVSQWVLPEKMMKVSVPIFSHYMFAFRMVDGKLDTRIYSPLKNEEYGAQVVSMAMRWILFKQFVEIEEIHATAGGKRKVGGKEYANRTNQNVKFITTEFFRKVHIESGEVCGHYKLQPCGIGLQERKLIYVEPYERGAYTRIAGKERESDI